MGRNFQQKYKGNITIGMLFIWLLLILIIILGFSIEEYFVNLKADMARDDIILSNLAAYKDIDIKSLGNVPPIFRINNPDSALETFIAYLKKNMRLSEDMMGEGNSIAHGTVRIKKYIIYNVSGNEAEIFEYDSALRTFTRHLEGDIALNPIISPCSTIISKTSIHTTLEFEIETVIRGIYGNTKTVTVMADTDITY